jgi:hypothetical protein
MKPLMVTVYLILLLAWTWLLLKPDPVPEIVMKSLLDDVKFLMAKGLHLSVYAAFAFLGTRLVPRHHRWVMVLLILHGIATELGQHFGDLWFQTHRTGTVRDGVIDAAGVLMGRWAGRRRELKTSRTMPNEAA